MHFQPRLLSFLPMVTLRLTIEVLKRTLGGGVEAAMLPASSSSPWYAESIAWAVPLNDLYLSSLKKGPEYFPEEEG